MYGQQSLENNLFLMFYGGIAMLALVAGLYLWLRRSNAITLDVNPPQALRQWTAAFLITAALSHVWWYVLGVYWLVDDRLVRNITAVTLDYITLVPLDIAMLLHMLQDRQRKVWPWALAHVPIAVLAAIGIVTRNEFYGLEITHYWQIVVIIIFVAYYINALKQYGKWLHENYADLEHKEIWQSLLFVVVLLVIHELYSTNPGEIEKEFLAQFYTLFIIAFLIWRVETLQELDAKEKSTAESEAEISNANISIPSNIGDLLQEHCEAQNLYLLHDLTLVQLGKAIGINRTYLSTYFAQQGISYSAYINRLRIIHFEQLYRETMASQQSVTAQQLAHECGFKSYSTFAVAFKQFEGQNVTTWMKSQTPDL